jgi:TonB-dependent receptor
MPVLFSLKRTLFLIILVPIIAFGQATLKGTVTDISNNEPLIGVNVTIQGTSLGAATDIEGKFLIFGIPERILDIKISCVGYEPLIESINFSRVRDASRKFQMKPTVIQGEEVVVTGQARGQQAAINQQLTATTLVNVVSTEKIKELPDANAAESIGRLPGVALQRSGGEATQIVVRGMSGGFSTVTLDGVKIPATDANTRGVDLSMMSQGSLAGIELYKALTPDKDADAIAGSVNLVTKNAPAERFFQVTAKGAYEKLDKTTNQYDFSIKYSDRFFNDVLGIQISGNLEKRDRSNENYRIDYQYINQLTDFQIETFTLQYTNETRKRGGANVIFDVNTPDDGSIKLSNNFSRTNRDYTTFGRTYSSLTNPIYTIRSQEQEIDNYNSSLHGKNYLFGLTVEWGFSFAQSKANFPYDYYIDFEEPSSATSGMRLPIPTQDLKNPAAFPNYAFDNFGKASLVWANYNTENNLDKEKTANLDLTEKYTLGNLFSGELKVGGKYRIKNRTKDEGELTNNYQIEGFFTDELLPDGTIVKKDFNGTRFQNLQIVNGNVLLTNFLDPIPATRNLYGKYPLNPLVNADAMRLWYDYNKNGIRVTQHEYLPNQFVAANAYDVTERVSAGYLMNTLNIGQDATLIVGVRVENENNDYGSKFSPNVLSGYPTITGVIKDTSASYTETVWLPNAHLSLKPFDFMSVRVAAYRALARPDFNYRLNLFDAQNAGSSLQRAADLSPALTVGNPRLADAKAWNYEISTSFFGNTIGLLTLSAYYKNITDMYHMADNIVVNKAQVQSYLDSVGIQWKNPFGPVSYYLTYPYTSPQSTHVWGFEIEQQTNMNFLPWLFKNFVLSYNVSVVRSETYIRSFQWAEHIDTGYVRNQPIINKTYYANYIDLKQKLEGQPELFGNVALGYDIGGFSARVSLFFQSEYTQTYSTDGTADIIVNKLSRWDLALKQQITSAIAVMLNVNNFTNVEENTSIRDRNTGWDLLYTSNNYGITADLGVQVTL